MDTAANDLHLKSETDGRIGDEREPLADSSDEGQSDLKEEKVEVAVVAPGEGDDESSAVDESTPAVSPAVAAVKDAPKQHHHKKVVSFLSPQRDEDGRPMETPSTGAAFKTPVAAPSVPSPSRTSSGQASSNSAEAGIPSSQITNLKKVFLPRGHAVRPSLSLRELVPPMIPRAVAIYCLRRVIVWALKRFFLNTNKATAATNLDARALKIGLFIISLFNAGIAAVFSFLFTERLEKLETKARENKSGYGSLPILNSRAEEQEYHHVMRTTREIVYMIFSYIAHDLCTILPDWRKSGADIFHHLTGLCISIAILRKPLTMLPMVPAITRLEVSTVPLNLMWLLKEAGLGGSFIGMASQLLFASTFFWFRVAWYPLFFWKVRAVKPDVWNKTIGATGKKLLAAQYALHVYWFGVIFKKVLRTTFANKKISE